jgi:putative ABC transport system permease protein
MPLALRISIRDLTAGLAGFRVFIACIVLGITAIVGVNSVTRSLSESLASESRRIMGGDASFSVIHRELNADELGWLEKRGRVSTIATLRAMARNGAGQSTLVELKSVGADYPSVGSLVTSRPSESLAQLLDPLSGRFGAIVEPSLLARLSLKVGDTMTIGDVAFTVRAELRSEPDKVAAGFALGPRVIISEEAFRKSGLLQPGSLARWSYRLVMPGTGQAVPTDEEIAATINAAQKAFPDAGWRVTARSNATARLSQNIKRFAQFLSLVGLTALIIGGVGVANAVRGFVERKRKDLAILKAVGASGSYVFLLALFEVMLVATIGVVFGVILGAALPFALQIAFGSILPVPFKAFVFPGELLLGALYGFMITVVFSVVPLGRIHDTPVSFLFRGQVSDYAGSVRPRYIIMALLAGAIFVVLLLLTAANLRIVLIYLAATAIIFVLLRLVGYAIIALARVLPRRGSPVLRMAISNIHRPGSLTQSVVLSIGLGLSLFVALVTIDHNIREPLSRGIPGETPSFFFLDIQKDQVNAFRDQIKTVAPTSAFEGVPMLRGRLTRINGKDPTTFRARENVRWVLEGDRGITFSATLPEGSELSEGAWWPANYSGPPLVSMESDAAEGLGLKIGDDVTVNIAGRNITAKIANLRDVNWRSFGINFIFVFSPSALAAAPHSYLATVTFPDGGDSAQENALALGISNNFPTITMVRIKDTLDSIAAIARQLAMAIQGATGVGLLASILVLAGAISASQSARRYDSVMLKVLGASRGTLLRTYLLEFLILSLAAATFAVGAGLAAAWVILTQVLELETFSLPVGGLAIALGLATIVTIGLGLAGTWRILGQRPATALRTL